MSPRRFLATAPADVEPDVAVMDRHWLAAEAASVYAEAAAVLSFEMHSPTMAIAGGTPVIHLRQPTDTSKNQMWRDVGLGDCSSRLTTPPAIESPPACSSSTTTARRPGPQWRRRVRSPPRAARR